MGEIVKQDRAISIKEMLALLDIAEDTAKGAIGHEDRLKWILLGAFAVIAYEGHTGPEALHHMVVALFKGEK
eukprot:14950580-Ditylum_brightwellii.AAC.1